MHGTNKQINKLPEFPRDLVSQFEVLNQDVDWTKTPVTIMLTVMRRCEELVVKMPTLIAEEVERKFTDAENFNRVASNHLREELHAAFYGENFCRSGGGISGQLERTLESCTDNLSKVETAQLGMDALLRSMTKNTSEFNSLLDKWLKELQAVLREDRRVRQDQVMALDSHKELKTKLDELTTEVKARDHHIDVLAKEIDNKKQAIDKMTKLNDRLRAEIAAYSRLGFWGRLWHYFRQ